MRNIFCFRGIVAGVLGGGFYGVHSLVEADR